ncbi:hypothetical protein ANN_23721 [Periplaneta americana]|uniref:RNase H type-1 domain-containing protein n=1 Tax=Periplaneta americana TaxID=6978 RepID=A0ABQ8SLW2_PERAM|nr:hypothetical protein ANN_23721 [Periplaneta americana]
MFSKWRSNLAYDKGYDYHHPKQKEGSDNSMISVKEPSLSETRSIALDKPTLSKSDYIGTPYQYIGRSPDPNLKTKDMDTRKEMHSLHGKSNSRYRKTNFATNRKTNSLTPISSRHQSKPTPCNLVSLPMPRVEKLEDLERLARSYSMHSNNDDLSQDVLGESLKKKRQLETVNTQHRGGQNCEDKSTPPYADANTYHDSAHCLRFSELWYSVYNLEKPVVVHNVYLQLFEKQNLPDGTTNWEDLTQGSLVRIGKFCREVIDKFPRVSFVFSPYEDESNENFNLDYKTMKLMTPQPVPRDKEDMFPQVQEEILKSEVNTEILKQLSLETINIRYPPQNWLHLYTDGSLISREQGASAGVTCCLFSLYISLGYGTTSFDGEIIAISENLRNLLCHISKFKNAVILSDSKTAILSIVSKHTSSTQTAEITKMLSQLISLNKRIVFQWIPSHCGILGNENEDALAKKGITATYRPVTKSTYYSVKKGGPNEFLVVTDDLISTSGNECDKAGVGYEAFVKQPDRCNKKRGTCLQNQPITLWRRDIVARMERKKGKHFLENYGTIPRDPIKINLETKEEYLGLEYYDMYTSTIDIEINADLNAIIDAGPLAELLLSSTPTALEHSRPRGSFPFPSPLSTFLFLVLTCYGTKIVLQWLKEGKLVINKISQLGPMDPSTNSSCGPPDILGVSVGEVVVIEAPRWAPFEGGGLLWTHVGRHLRVGASRRCVRFTQGSRDVKGFTPKSKHSMRYPNIPSAMRPVSHSEDLPVPIAPDKYTLDSEEDTSDARCGQDPDFQPSPSMTCVHHERSCTGLKTLSNRCRIPGF